MKSQPYTTLLAICLSAATAAVGQAPQAPPLARSMSAGSYIPPTLKQTAQLERASQLAHTAAIDLHAGRYAQAEPEARQALALEPGYGVPAEVLASALEAQGRDQEALQAYQTVIEHYDRQPRNLLPYALLLLKSGQWTQAVAIYNQTLPSLGNDELEKETRSFSPEVPEPAALATAIHLERGQIYNGTPSLAGELQNKEAMGEYQKALQLAPDNALTNYFYGVGWQKLSPMEQAKFGTVQQAKAHLRKAEKVGNANVKAAAKKALKALG